jgi:hypothetical protein
MEAPDVAKNGAHRFRQVASSQLLAARLGFTPDNTTNQE